MIFIEFLHSRHTIELVILLVFAKEVVGSRRTAITDGQFCFCDDHIFDEIVWFAGSRIKPPKALAAATGWAIASLSRN